MYDLEEQEQIDALKAWWKQHGRLVIVAVLAAAIAAAATAGWRYHKQSQTKQASELYVTLEKAERSNDLKQIREVSGQLTQQFPSTLYAPMAALVAAKANFDAGDLDGAATQLEWAVEHARDEQTTAVARLRLAGVRLDQKKYDEALQLLQQPHPAAFDGLYADLRGDVLTAQGKTDEARAAYKLALDKLGSNSSYRMVVQAKLDGLGATP